MRKPILFAIVFVLTLLPGCAHRGRLPVDFMAYHPHGWPYHDFDHRGFDHHGHGHR